MESCKNKMPRHRCPDIHFEPEDKFVCIRYRIDGVLRQICAFHQQYWSMLCVRLKIISGLNIAESRLPQDGRFSLNVCGRDVDFRASSLPTQHGENIVIASWINALRCNHWKNWDWLRCKPRKLKIFFKHLMAFLLSQDPQAQEKQLLSIRCCITFRLLL